MIEKPNPLLIEIFDEDLPIPTINRDTEPTGVNPADAWEMYDMNKWFVQQYMFTAYKLLLGTFEQNLHKLLTKIKK